MNIEDRKRKEVEHSDQRRSIVRSHEYHTDAASRDEFSKEGSSKDEEEYKRHFSNMKFYSVTRTSFALRDQYLYQDIKGAVALDYCCGNGEVAVEMAKRGAKKVYGIDISQVAVDNARKLAESEGVGNICEFSVMDAENMEFADNTFDVIHEYGALHHLELQSAFAELSRTLKPTGRLVCTEAMRHNPLIHWYRNRTMHLRTEWEVEHILGVPELKTGQNHFSGMHMRMFHLFALGAVPFRKFFFFKPLLTILEAIDTVVLMLPGIRRMAWVSVVEYSKPNKTRS